MDTDRKPIDGFTAGIYLAGTDIPVDYTHSGARSNPDHQIDGRPIPQTIKFISDPEPWQAYRGNQVIEIEINYNIDVHVGGADRRATVRSEDAMATQGYVDSAVFEYQVQEGDNDNDGIGLFANSLKLNGGGIHDRAGNGLGLTHPAITADAGQKVDTTTETSPSQPEDDLQE